MVRNLAPVDETADVPTKGTIDARVPDPSGESDGDVLNVDTGALAYVGPTVIDAVARGLAKDGSDQSTLLNTLVNETGRLVIPGGGTVTLGSSVTVTKTYSEIDATGFPTLKFTSAGAGLVIGNAASSRPSGFTRNLKIEGSGGGAPQTARGGAIGLKLYGRRQHRVDNVTVRGYDIAFDADQNCYGSHWSNCTAATNENNVGMNIRDGNNSGNDLVFTNCWLSGAVAGVYCMSNSGGFHFFGGQISGGRNASIGDVEGALVIGKDYLTGSTGAGIHGFDLVGVDVEQFLSCYALRLYGQINLFLRNVSIIANEQLPGNIAEGVINWTDPAGSKVEFDACYLNGVYNQLNLSTLSGSIASSFTMMERNWTNNNITLDANDTAPTLGGGNLYSLAEQAGLKQYGVALFRKGTHPTVMLGNHFLRLHNTTRALEFSTDNSTWTDPLVLGSMLDVNGKALGDGVRELVTFTEDASAVNHVNIENEATGGGPIISAAGDDTNVDLNLAGKGTGVVNASGARVLTTADEGTGNGLDADTVDGQEASAFAAASHNHAAGDVTSGTLVVARGGTGVASVTTNSYLRGQGTSAMQERTAAETRSDIGANDAANITAGTLAVARGGTGIASYTTNNYVRASGATTLEQRTPAQVRGDVGADNASNLASGTVGTARLGSGTADSTAYLRGDQTWQNFDTRVRTSRLDQMAAPTASVALNSQNITGLAAATANGHAVRYEQMVAVALNEQTGTSYTLVLADAGKLVRCNNASAFTLTVPPNSSVAFPTGCVINVVQSGAGQVTVAPGSGVTLNKPSTHQLKTAVQYAQVTLVKTATDTWLVGGQMAAV